MNMLRFAHEEFLYGYLLVPVFIFLFWLTRRWKTRALHQFGDISLIQKLFPEVSVTRPLIKFMTLVTGYSILLYGVCGPLIGSKLEEVKRKGIDLVIALDISNSMKAEDLKPNRLEKAKQSINRLIDKLQGDRIGLVIFAGEAYTQLPITSDYGAAKLFVSTIEPDIISRQGTTISKALSTAADAFTDSLRKHSAIIVITDGEDNEGEAVETAKEVAAKGVRIYTIGMGSLEGAPIPIYSNGVRVGFKQDRSGTTVVTKFNPELLSEIAEAGRGKFFHATESDDGLENIFKDLTSLEKKEFQAKMFTDFENQYQYFAGAGLLLLLFEFLLGENKSRLISRWNPFAVRKKGGPS